MQVLSKELKNMYSITNDVEMSPEFKVKMLNFMLKSSSEPMDGGMDKLIDEWMIEWMVDTVMDDLHR